MEGIGETRWGIPSVALVGHKGMEKRRLTYVIDPILVILFLHWFRASNLGEVRLTSLPHKAQCTMRHQPHVAACGFRRGVLYTLPTSRKNPLAQQQKRETEVFSIALLTLLNAFKKAAQYPWHWSYFRYTSAPDWCSCQLRELRVCESFDNTSGKATNVFTFLGYAGEGTVAATPS